MKRVLKAVRCALFCAAAAAVFAAGLWPAWGSGQLHGYAGEAAPLYEDVFRPYVGPAIKLWPALERMYYGRCFSDMELAGLALCEGSGSYVYLDTENGCPAADAAGYCWANGTYSDGSPLAVCDGGQTVTLTAAKSGILRCWVWPQQEAVFSWHDGETALTVYEYTVGYAYGEDGVPQQSFVRFCACFTIDGTEYELVADAVEKAVFESAVRQVMWGT